MPAYRDENKKTWYVKFRYRDWQGKSRHTTKRGFKTKKDALSYEYNFKQNSKDRVAISVSALIENYLADRKIHVKSSTYSGMYSSIKSYILPYLGNLQLTELTPQIMRQWQNQIVQSKLKPYTQLKINRYCSAILNYAVKFYGLSQNPLKITGNIGQVESSKNFWELREFEQFIKNVDDSRYKICFELLFFSGMRIGELLALNLEDFDFESNKINVTKTKDHATKIRTTPKTKYSLRVVEMPAVIMQGVKNYVQRLDKIPNPLFNVGQASVSAAMKKYIKRSGVKAIKIHDLRHSHASLLINNGIPIPIISRRLGHKSPKITLSVYSHMYEEAGNQVIELIDRLI